MRANGIRKTPRLGRTAVAAALLGLLAAFDPGPAAAQVLPPEAVEDYIERTGEIVARAAEVVAETAMPHARQLLDEAARLHARSLALLAEGRPRLALTASRQARNGAIEATRLARESLALEERVRLRLERLQELHDQVLERASEGRDERALRFLREAQEQIRRAQEHYRQGDFQLAMQLLDPADALLLRAARLAMEGGGLERELERTRALLERAAEGVASLTGRSADTARELLRSAREALARADDFRAAGMPLRALHSCRLARSLAAEAVSTGGQPIGPEAVREQIERWDRRHDEIAGRVLEAGGPAGKQALERAAEHRRRAGRLLEEGEPGQALRQIKAALDLLNEAAELAR